MTVIEISPWINLNGTLAIRCQLLGLIRIREAYTFGSDIGNPLSVMEAPSLQSLQTHYASRLKQFQNSNHNFEVLASITHNSHDAAASPDVLYVLDSSFNPPTLAHRRIACSALLETSSASPRLLLLLATQNADKPSKPASFEDRLTMMDLFARDLLSHLQATSPANNRHTLSAVDVAVTKKPYFVDKAAEIEKAGVYPQSLEQIHLTGYDTLIRIFDPKYYPPEHTLKSLEPFLSQHRLRVTLRPDSSWGSRDEQEAFLRDLAEGRKDDIGGKREWAQRIQLVEGRKPGAPSVSSTKAREAVTANPQGLEWLVPSNIQEMILSEQLYAN
ncbi:nicotinate-nicotinamide nucleotide adenylyltransferase [Aspergillus saccharolyticus JOP 1030-1]|uniref:Nucleotidylyl transferase n=1 Tax=Aspergillus saccharolyticus JOP 1030-1 TaxID=1450539 RepID=A0A318ZIR1_9EURO|nr:Nucleotidylyl transferase [Aspergillus saccharolyticus JOP 1030-1]PYH47471.1 Nucleotidylyl transferase [Aspergillus saccharolyticus JOP 1030-1]